jgi:hypothetical protein
MPSAGGNPLPFFVHRADAGTGRRRAALSRTLSNVAVIGCKGIDSMTRST